MVPVVNAVVHGQGLVDRNLDLDGQGHIVLDLRNVLAQGLHDLDAVPDQGHQNHHLSQRIVNVTKAGHSHQSLVAPASPDLAAKAEKTKEVIHHQIQIGLDMEIPKESLKMTGVRSLHDIGHVAQEASHRYHIHLERIKTGTGAVWNMTVEENEKLIVIVKASVIRSLETSEIMVTGSRRQNIVVTMKNKREKVDKIKLALIQKNVKWMRKRREVQLKKVMMMSMMQNKPHRNLIGLISRTDQDHRLQIVLGLMKIRSLLMPICPGWIWILKVISQLSVYCDLLKISQLPLQEV